jgi:hypothetical protein
MLASNHHFSSDESAEDNDYSSSEDFHRPAHEAVDISSSDEESVDSDEDGNSDQNRTLAEFYKQKMNQMGHEKQ